MIKYPELVSQDESSVGDVQICFYQSIFCSLGPVDLIDLFWQVTQNNLIHNHQIRKKQYISVCYCITGTR